MAEKVDHIMNDTYSLFWQLSWSAYLFVQSTWKIIQPIVQHVAICTMFLISQEETLLKRMDWKVARLV